MPKKALKISVDEYTSPSPISVKPTASGKSIMSLMHDHGIRHVPVIDQNNIVGVISERDLRVVACVGDLDSVMAEQIMIKDPYTVSSDTPLDLVVFEMSTKKIGSAIVLDENGSLTGIFTNTDAMNALVEIVRGVLPEQ